MHETIFFSSTEEPVDIIWSFCTNEKSKSVKLVLSVSQDPERNQILLQDLAEVQKEVLIFEHDSGGVANICQNSKKGSYCCRKPLR